MVYSYNYNDVSDDEGGANDDNGGGNDDDNGGGCDDERARVCCVFVHIIKYCFIIMLVFRERTTTVQACPGSLNQICAHEGFVCVCVVCLYLIIC